MTNIEINLSQEEIEQLEDAREHNAPDLSLEEYLASLIHNALERMNPPPF